MTAPPEIHQLFLAVILLVGEVTGVAAGSLAFFFLAEVGTIAFFGVPLTLSGIKKAKTLTFNT